MRYRSSPVAAADRVTPRKRTIRLILFEDDEAYETWCHILRGYWGEHGWLDKDGRTFIDFENPVVGLRKSSMCIPSVASVWKTITITSWSSVVGLSGFRIGNVCIPAGSSRSSCRCT